MHIFSMERKTININPNLFDITKRKSSQKKELPLRMSKPTNLKKELIQKIKNFQNKTKKKKQYPLDNTFHNEFKESIEYLRNVIQEKKMENEDSNTTMNTTMNTNTNIPPLSSQVSGSISTPSSYNSIPSNTPTTVSASYPSLPPVEIKPDLPYGVLKNGSKPTYRNWIKTGMTLKNKQHPPNNPEATNAYVNQESIGIVSNDDMNQAVHQNTLNKPRRIKRKTIKKKYTCGKLKTKKQISVIIKSMKTKNKVLREKRDLKNEPMQKIRNFLYKNSFIKVGSTAPDKVLRDMYESIILTGKVHNKNSHIMVHNYMNNEQY